VRLIDRFKAEVYKAIKNYVKYIKDSHNYYRVNMLILKCIWNLKKLRSAIALLLISLLAFSLYPTASAQQNSDKPSWAVSDTTLSYAGKCGSNFSKSNYRFDFRFHNVTLFVRDENNIPVKGAYVKAFSSDWGIMYPHFEEWGSTDNKGSYKFTLPTGNWVFIASSGHEYSVLHPNKGFYITYATLIKDEVSINLKPGYSFKLEFHDKHDNVLPIDEIYIVGNSFKPIVPPVYVGTSNNGFFNLFLGNMIYEKLTIIAVKRAKDNENYILEKNLIPAHDNGIVSAKRFPNIILSGYDESGGISPYWSVLFRFPEYYALGWGISFKISKMTVFHIPPTPVILNGVYAPPNWYYYFDDIGLTLKENETYVHSFGGKGSFHPWIIKEGTQLMFDIRDSFGNVVSYYSSNEKHAWLTIKEDGNILFNDDVGNKLGNWNIYSIRKTFSDNAQFELKANLGPLGGLKVVEVKGDLYGNNTLVPYREICTNNFIVYAPIGHFFNVSGQDRTIVFLTALEQIYDAMGKVLGENLSVKPHRVKINFEWCGVGGYNFVGFGLGVARWPVNVRPEYAAIIAHELGHMYSFTPPLIYGVECPMYCEPLATYLGFEALAYLYGSSFRLWCWGANSHLLDYISGGKNFPETERMEFVFFYLHKTYGPEIHKQFIQLWANNTVLKNKLLGKGFNTNETMITLYSYLAGENLVWLFQLAGYNVSEDRINEGLKLVLVETPSYLVSGVKSLWCDGTPGPILILDNQTIPIVSGDRNTIPIPSVVVAAREFGKGRVVASLGGFFTDKALGLFDNRVFARNVIEWLSRLNRGKILVSRGHSEWDFGPGFDEFRGMLENLGCNVTLYYGPLSPEILSNYDVLLIGTAWGNLKQEEISAILNFVNNGGGLLLTGLGWSWPDLTLNNYPMNIIGERFGIHWIDSYIEDKDPQDNYNGSPIFHVFYPSIEISTIPQAIAFINDTLEKYSNNLPSILGSSPETRWKFFTANELLLSAALNLEINSSKRLELYDFYKQLFLSYPQLFRRNVTYDKNTESAMAWIRERSYFAYITAILLYSEGLTSHRIKEIADVLGLSGKYRDIWIDHQIMILDNGLSSEKQLNFIYKYISLIPRELHNLRFISIRDFLGPLPNDVLAIGFPFFAFSRLTNQLGTVNVFGNDVGSIRENEFPDDVEPYETDAFSIIVVHEVNHVIDAYYISRNATLSERKNVLIKRAGYSHMNYLRSMFPDSFFIQYPQEFFASIANQWFANTSHMLKLALVRFDKGCKEPINQFLFFADVYSRGGKATLFCTIDVEGNMEKRDVTVLRDGQGKVTGLVDGKIVYRFTLDPKDYVESYSISIDTTPPTTTHDYDGLWHTSDITIVLSSNDDLNNVAEIFYRINNGSVKRVSVDGYPVITTEGANNTLEYWSIDNIGNEESRKILTGIKLDKTSPLINIARAQIRDAEFTISWIGSDDLSGIDHYEIRLDGGEWINVGVSTTYTFKDLASRMHMVYIKAVDIAGNVNTTHMQLTVSTTQTITTSPTTTATIMQTNWAIIITLAIILLIIGALIGYMIKKK
jgi:hypothetical protein